jgi:hypothetical protein
MQPPPALARERGRQALEGGFGINQIERLLDAVAAGAGQLDRMLLQCLALLFGLRERHQHGEDLG